MKSPQLSTVITAVVFAIITYFITTTISAEPVIAAACVFIGSFLAPLLTNSSESSSTGATSTADTDDLKTLYVGNLPYRANEAAVKELFANYGHVQSVRLMKDKHTGKRRGFGFVEMAANDINKAISALNDTEFQQRTLKVREAKERPERTSSEGI
ncbi:MAG: RNA-binding protein [Colwellia sp.]|nr:RNA-binding protein [Colwellia sp.]MCW8864189.1 RNA-binding protein [Colwellia sp.]MCW9082810.1 RNA-binding protein [Colwellia sp.]